MSRPIVFLDCETTSLRHDRQAWEVAMVRYDEYGGERETSFFIFDVDLTEADPQSLAIGRFYERHPVGRQQAAGIDAGGDDDVDVVKELAAAWRIARWTHGATIVGAQPSFDTETLAPLLRRHGIVPGWHYRLRCIESMCCGYDRIDSGGLQAWAERLLPDHDKDAAHTALGDARTVAKLWDRIFTTDEAGVR